jgi:hypothetical protein
MRALVAVVALALAGCATCPKPTVVTVARPCVDEAPPPDGTWSVVLGDACSHHVCLGEADAALLAAEIQALRKWKRLTSHCGPDAATPPE